MCKCLGLPEAGKYATAPYSIKPFTTLHTAGYGGGGLNLETACLAAIALYTPTPCSMSSKPSASLAVLVLRTAMAVALAVLVVLKLLRGSAKPRLKPMLGVLVAVSLAPIGVPMAKQLECPQSWPCSRWGNSLVVLRRAVGHRLARLKEPLRAH
uniref:Uncharacterized protein n=1 Tax=Ignisphaera aggregans TaxID=334771 RepID=A0A7C4BB96_9CREN